MGRYQIRFISAMCYLGFFVSGFQTMIMTFIATEPGWRCVTNSTLCNTTGVYRPGDVGYNDRCDRKLPSSEWEYEDTFTSTVTEVCTGQFEISRPHLPGIFTFGNEPLARNGHMVQKAPSQDVAAARKLKANWFATQTRKQWRTMVNNELPLFKRTNQLRRYEQLLHYRLAGWERSQRARKPK